MKVANILLVEDDEYASEIIYDFLQECSFNVTPVFTATDAVAHLKSKSFDLVILDINLPDFDGYEVLKSIKNYVSLPIIVTSADSDTQSKLLAFKYGASDYMVKPLNLEELEARMWVHLSSNSNIIPQLDKNKFDYKDNTIYFQGTPLNLTTIEFEILSILLQNKNQVVTREELIESLSLIGTNRSLDNHIKNIRKKIGDTGSQAMHLKTKYGVGYSLYT
jgi:DNA-binding response OmpR family regulator